jgi:hypothetical protein
MKAMLEAQGRRFDAGVLHKAVDGLIARRQPPGEGAASELPVFIVGMPRSGTSLVEQIAASHPSVFGAGELRAIPDIAKAPDPFDPAIALAHLAHLQSLAPRASRVIDTTPDNLFQLGLIARLYKGARVILCRRDPRDTCLSCFFTLLPSGNLFSFDLGDCGIRYFETERMAAHAFGTLDLRMLTVHYEDVVADLEGESRRLIDFLGLPWDPACLEFYKTKRVVTTASFWQVRQPIYAKSVGRWRNYEKHLGPLMAGLEGRKAAALH